MELIGTKRVVSKKDQVKFYADPDLMNDFQKVIDHQGLTLSEAMSRLMSLLLSVPDTMRPIILSQAPGDAAKALARYTLRLGTNLTREAASQSPSAQKKSDDKNDRKK